MRNTWHFKLPESLLQPTIHEWAAQQGISTMTQANIQGILLLFQTFSVFSDLPLGLNPKQRKSLRDELHKLKQNPNTSISEINILVKKINHIKEDYHRRKQLALEQQLPIFVIYESDDLVSIATKILKPIGYYITNAKNEINGFKSPEQDDSPFSIFSKFIKETEDLLKKHQEMIAQCMLLRLQEADMQHSIQHLSPRNFSAFHRYIKKYGNIKTQNDLNELSWIKNNIVSLNSIIKPKKPLWPQWLFRGNYVLYRAFGDTHHQTSIALQTQRLQSINSHDPQQLETVEKIQHSITQEIQRLRKLQKKLFWLFHSDESEKINQQLKKLNIYRQHATHLHQKINTKVQAIHAENLKNQKKQAALREQVSQYNAETAKLYFLELINNGNNIIVIDKVEYKNDQETQQLMRQYLKDTTTLQAALLRRIQSTNASNFSATHILVELLGNTNTQAIWQYYVDQYRFNCFIKVILDTNNSPALLTEFLFTLHQVALPFPSTEMIHQQLMRFIKYIPTENWTVHQHQAFEALHSHPILAEYYARAIDYYPLADLIIQRFSQEQLAEIEFPELKEPLEKLIQRRLIDKEAQVTATLVKTEIEQGQVASALSRLNRLQQNLHSEKAKQQIIIVSEKLTESQINPQLLSSQLKARLRGLLQEKTHGANYLEQLLEIKALAEELPYSQEYIAIKRICAAGQHIPNILNELTNSILAFASGETTTISVINPLLLDIIDADLIPIEKKSSLLKLIEATLFDPQNTLASTEKRRLLALKKCLDKTANDHDRACFIDDTTLNPHRLSQQNISTEYQPIQGDLHESTIRHF